MIKMIKGFRMDNRITGRVEAQERVIENNNKELMLDAMHILCSSSKSDLPGKLLIVGQPIYGIRFSTYRPDTFAVVHIGEQFKLDYEKIKWIHSDLVMCADKNIRSKDLTNLLFDKIKLRLN